MPLPGDVGRRAVHRLEHRRALLRRVQVRRRRDADRPGDRGSKVGEDVAEQVRPHHHVEPLRLQHELGGQRVDVFAVEAHVRVQRGALGHDLVPERERVHDPVRFRGRRDVAAASLRELEGVVGDPAHANPRENRLLHRHLVGEPAVQPAADLAVLALDVLPDDDEVDVVGGPQRALHTLEHPDRAQVDVLPERPPDRDQQAPQRHVVRHARPADGAEQDRVEPAQRIDAVGGHHRALAFVALARPVEFGVVAVDPVARADGVQYRAGRRDHLAADPVAGDHGDLLSGHPPQPDHGDVGPIALVFGCHRFLHGEQIGTATSGAGHGTTHSYTRSRGR